MADKLQGRNENKPYSQGNERTNNQSSAQSSGQSPKQYVENCDLGWC
ncbi:hypothetical protein BSNK01_09080 [Bacillaceae bacterium]